MTDAIQRGAAPSCGNWQRGALIAKLRHAFFITPPSYNLSCQASYLAPNQHGPERQGKATEGPFVQPLRSAQTSAGPSVGQKAQEQRRGRARRQPLAAEKAECRRILPSTKACEDYIASGHGQLVWHSLNLRQLAKHTRGRDQNLHR